MELFDITNDPYCLNNLAETAVIIRIKPGRELASAKSSLLTSEYRIALVRKIALLSDEG